MRPRFFASPAAFRRWLEAHHRDTAELWVGFHKAHTRKKGLTYPQAVDEALCFGWIDGLKKRFDDAAFMQRFTPRRARSIWSLVNTRRIAELIKEGLVTPVGLQTFQQRDEKRSGIYSYENLRQPLAPAHEKLFKANRKAGEFFRAQPPGYQKLATRWIMDARKEETQVKRLKMMIDAAAKGKRWT